MKNYIYDLFLNKKLINLGVERIGHIEFHVKDEADISYRAFEICAMMKRKKPHLDMFQIIAYMGEKPAQHILTEHSGSQYSHRIKLIQFIKIPVEVFLNSESAAEILLGVLGDFGDKSAEIVLPQLIKGFDCRRKILWHFRKSNTKGSI